RPIEQTAEDPHPAGVAARDRVCRRRLLLEVARARALGRTEGRGTMSKRLRYQVAVSLDGFIAGPNGEYDWIVSDPSIDFGALYKEFDTVVVGRKTYEVMTAQGGHGAMPGLDGVVFSRSLPPATPPGGRI